MAAQAAVGLEQGDATGFGELVGRAEARDTAADDRYRTE